MQLPSTFLWPDFQLTGISYLFSFLLFDWLGNWTRLQSIWTTSVKVSRENAALNPDRWSFAIEGCHISFFQVPVRQKYVGSLAYIFRRLFSSVIARFIFSLWFHKTRIQLHGSRPRFCTVLSMISTNGSKVQVKPKVLCKCLVTNNWLSICLVHSQSSVASHSFYWCSCCKQDLCVASLRAGNVNQKYQAEVILGSISC